MDGVIYHGNRMLPGAIEFIDWLQREDKEYLFLTNNSGYTPQELQQKLARMGLDVSEEHFYTSALATAAFLKEQAPGCSVYAIGEAGLFNALYDAGIIIDVYKRQLPVGNFIPVDPHPFVEAHQIRGSKQPGAQARRLKNRSSDGCG